MFGDRRGIRYDPGGMWRAFAIALLMYITLDFSDPNLPGALNFDLDQSVDAVHTQLRGHLPVDKTSIDRVSPSPDVVQLSARPEAAPVRSLAVTLRTPTYVRPRALLSEARPLSGTEPH